MGIAAIAASRSGTTRQRYGNLRTGRDHPYSVVQRLLRSSAVVRGTITQS